MGSDAWVVSSASLVEVPVSAAESSGAILVDVTVEALAEACRDSEGWWRHRARARFRARARAGAKARAGTRAVWEGGAFLPATCVCVCVSVRVCVCVFVYVWGGLGGGGGGDGDGVWGWVGCLVMVCVCARAPCLGMGGSSTCRADSTLVMTY